MDSHGARHHMHVLHEFRAYQGHRSVVGCVATVAFLKDRSNVRTHGDVGHGQVVWSRSGRSPGGSGVKTENCLLRTLALSGAHVSKLLGVLW